MERYEACSPLRPHFCLRCTKKPAAKQKVAMQAGRQTVTYRRQSGEGQTGNGQTQQPDRRWAYRQWWTSEGQTDNSRQAGSDKRLPDGRQTDKGQTGRLQISGCQTGAGSGQTGGGQQKFGSRRPVGRACLSEAGGSLCTAGRLYRYVRPVPLYGTDCQEDG